MREAGQRRNPAALSEVECVLFFYASKSDSRNAYCLRDFDLVLAEKKNLTYCEKT